MKNFTKRKSGILLVVALMFVAMACGKQEDNTLAGKKSQLAELKKNESEIAEKIKVLQSEIEKLEPLKIEKVKTVVVSTITPSTFQHYVEATGRVEAVNNQFVSPQAELLPMCM